MRTRVKICGITRQEDAAVCANAGVDAIGLVFYEPSPRAVTISQAQAIVQSLPAFVTSVGLFVNADKEQVMQVLDAVTLDCLQFHGDEQAGYCEQFDHPYIKAIRMDAGADIESLARQHSSAKALLLDTYVADLPGGTGQAFDWGRVPAECSRPIILAGGLTPDNVGEAIVKAKPYAVDVSGGVELSKGIKDAIKIEKFISEVERLGSSK
ncbi:MAG: phosphoribosylanthranilate isomerase [Thioalkalispiraceae bacterium]|jgi:phosphoribosylanthranilate isomerase